MKPYFCVWQWVSESAFYRNPAKSGNSTKIRSEANSKVFDSVCISDSAGRVKFFFKWFYRTGKVIVYLSVLDHLLYENSYLCILLPDKLNRSFFYRIKFKNLPYLSSFLFSQWNPQSSSLAMMFADPIYWNTWTYVTWPLFFGSGENWMYQCWMHQTDRNGKGCRNGSNIP